MHATHKTKCVTLDEVIAALVAFNAFVGTQIGVVPTSLITVEAEKLELLRIVISEVEEEFGVLD